MKNNIIKTVFFFIIFIFILSFSGFILADTSGNTQSTGGHEVPSSTNTDISTTTKPVPSTAPTSTEAPASTSEAPSSTATETTSSGTTTSIYKTDYVLTSQDKVLLVNPSVCFITSLWTARVYDDNLQAWSKTYTFGPVSGTGFCINPETGHIVTAAHVIDVSYKDIKTDILDQYFRDAYPEDYVALSQSDWDTIDSHFKVEGIKDILPDREVWVQFNTATSGIADNPDENHMRAEVIAISDVNNRDIGIIQVTPRTGRAISGAIIGDSSMVEILDPVTIIGYPWTSDIGQDNILNPTITEGSLSGRIMVNGMELLQLQGNARPGSSGGPVLDSRGEVIGIITMGTDSTNNYLRPSNDIKILLGKIKNKTGLVDEEWKTGIIMFREQHYKEAIKHFNAVLNLNNGHLLAQEYKAKAQASIAQDRPLATETTSGIIESSTVISTQKTVENPDTLKNSRKSLILIFSGGFILLAAVIIVIVLVLRRQSNKNKIKKSFHVTSASQPTIIIEELKAGREEKLKNGIKAKFCTNCGLKVEDDQDFCPNCGARLK